MIHTAKQLKDKVKNMSGGNSEVAQALIRTYFMERFLERVSVSEYRNNFILKGGMLVASIVGVDMRATMDIDTTVKALTLNEKDARAIIERIGELQLEDGITFKIKSVKEIMEDFDYPGIRMMIEANLERMRQPFKIDISTDDAITPGAVEYKYKLSCVDSCTRFSYVFPECFAPDPVKRFRENIENGGFNVKKICDLMEKVLYIVGMASVAVFFVCTTVQVCSRVFGFQAAFTEEVANAALAWCCFIGSAPMVRSNEHFKFTALTEKLKGKSLFADELAGHIFVLIFNLVVGIYGIKLVQQFAAWKMTSMPVSKGWSWLCVPIFGLTAAVFSVENIIDCIKHPDRGQVEDAVEKAMKEAEL